MNRIPRDEKLLNAIIEFPEEDTPRLEYADWLEEQNPHFETCDVCKGVGYAEKKEPNTVFGGSVLPLGMGGTWAHQVGNSDRPWGEQGSYKVKKIPCVPCNGTGKQNQNAIYAEMIRDAMKVYYYERNPIELFGVPWIGGRTRNLLPNGNGQSLEGLRDDLSRRYKQRQRKWFSFRCPAINHSNSYECPKCKNTKRIKIVCRRGFPIWIHTLCRITFTDLFKFEPHVNWDWDISPWFRNLLTHFPTIQRIEVPGFTPRFNNGEYYWDPAYGYESNLDIHEDVLALPRLSAIPLLVYKELKNDIDHRDDYRCLIDLYEAVVKAGQKMLKKRG